ncbi:MAG: epimerase, partial [Pseudomonadota bacterium]
IRAGWQIRRFDRGSDNLDRLAEQADVIVNGWNPAYPDWAAQLPGLHESVIRAARKSGATVILPGNVYVFGAETAPPWSEHSPHQATNLLGRLRIGMEGAYREAGVRTILLRAGDFIDTRASGNWFDMIMIKSLAKGRFAYPGDPEIAHSWAYLPDLARAAVELSEKRRTLPHFCDIPFPGYTLSGRDLADILASVTNKPVHLRRMNWLPLHFARPVWPMARFLLEMRYLWNTAHALDGTLFDKYLPGFWHTHPEQALATAIPDALVERQIDPDQPVPAGGQGRL